MRDRLSLDEMTPDAETIVLCYSSNAKKQRTFFEDMSKVCEQQSIRLVDLEQWRKADDVHAHRTFCVHKRTDDLVAAQLGDVAAEQRVRVFRAALDQCDVVVDAISAVEDMIDRQRMYTMLDTALAAGVEPPALQRVPWMAVDARTESAEQIARRMQIENVSFPVTVKTRVACGTSWSHLIRVVSDIEGLVKVAREHIRTRDNDGIRRSAFGDGIVLQDWVPHSSVVFKVYSIGERVYHVEPRRSFTLEAHSWPAVFVINSQDQKETLNAHPSIEEFGDHIANAGRPASLEVPSMQIIQDLVMRIQAHSKLSLLGIDIAKDERTGRYAVLDVNYFPTFRSVPDAHAHLLQHVLHQGSRV
ncbi:Inositol-tetrakisphosphate 1-kinase [Porphyridium purpureum]|uniref:inositol-1,3,4-trisphosphate 5/6-kinase n=1 Tax=Porphyridium purpureum TaxID=35688 RepID=A0A5J4YNH4_PORPP|nr:Inositol-tetrakisphosphate 1-kinase [Porphyridium purpureum]|eukprot:POR5618..scf222_8